MIAILLALLIICVTCSFLLVVLYVAIAINDKEITIDLDYERGTNQTEG